MKDEQNTLSEIQESIEGSRRKLLLAEENYRIVVNTCRISDAKQFKTQIEYYQQTIRGLEQEQRNIDDKNI